MAMEPRHLQMEKRYVLADSKTKTVKVPELKILILLLRYHHRLKRMEMELAVTVSALRMQVMDLIQMVTKRTERSSWR
jgi:hypothetical protein